MGLTATPLPKNTTDEGGALDEIYKLMANTNCYILSTVIRHSDSLEKQVSKPDEGIVFRIRIFFLQNFIRKISLVQMNLSDVSRG